METSDDLSPAGLTALGDEFMIIFAAISVLFIVASWEVFRKAGKPGWAALIPIYNAIVLLEIVGKPWWWFLLYVIPVVDVFIAIIVLRRLSLSFGQGAGTTILLVLGIGWLFLGFGKAKYLGPPPP